MGAVLGLCSMASWVTCCAREASSGQGDEAGWGAAVAVREGRLQMAAVHGRAGGAGAVRGCLTAALSDMQCHALVTGVDNTELSPSLLLVIS